MTAPMTLSDLERQDANGQTFLEDLRIHALTVSPRTTKFVAVTPAGEERVFRVQPRGRGTSVPKKLLGPFRCAHMVQETK